MAVGGKASDAPALAEVLAELVFVLPEDHGKVLLQLRQRLRRIEPAEGGAHHTLQPSLQIGMAQSQARASSLTVQRSAP